MRHVPRMGRHGGDGRDGRDGGDGRDGDDGREGGDGTMDGHAGRPLRVVVTGAAGFLGSHLCDLLLDRGHDVVGIDNLATGAARNVASAQASGRFALLRRDLCEPLHVEGRVDRVYHLASPASPPDYLRLPLDTLRVGSRGTEHALVLAASKGARFLLASTSEVYGDPEVTPQDEGYWGHVNPIGPRSVYDEAKRYAEALTMAWHRARGLDTRIARIFNTHGPRMRLDDGRAVPNFIAQLLQGEPLTLHGSGAQTRSFAYVDDTVAGLEALMEHGDALPCNLGNPHEVTILELAERLARIAGAELRVVHDAAAPDDPQRRCPDIARARTLLGWEPRVGLDEGLRRTWAWFRDGPRHPLPPMPEPRGMEATLPGSAASAASAADAAEASGSRGNGP